MASAYSDLVKAETGIRSQWRLGESSGTNAVDDQGINAGTYNGTPTLAQPGGIEGDRNTAVLFDGVDDRVDCGLLGNFGSSLLTSSYEFWIKTTTTSTVRAAFGTVNTGTGVIVGCYLNSSLEVGSAGLTEFHVRGNTTGTIRGTINTNIYDGQWHHVVMVVASATTLAVYVDGVSRTITYDQQTTINAGNFGFAFQIGCRNLRGVMDRFCPATIDEFAVYTSQLTAAKALKHYQEGVSRNRPPVLALQGVQAAAVR